MENNDIESDAKSLINLMDLDKLIKLNNYIIKRMGFISETKAMERVWDFELLDKVYFLDDNGNSINGTVIKLNKKTVTITTESGMEWRVSPYFLKKFIE
jgi:hypothetical protein